MHKVTVSVYPVANPNSKVLAMASITFNDEFVVSGIKVIEGSKGLFVAMPSYQQSNGDYKDIAYPITKKAREKLTDMILYEYNMNIKPRSTFPNH